MQTSNFTFSFETTRSPEEIFNLITDIKSWWSGLYGEEITGNANAIGDEFTFSAGGGAHYSKQKLVELVPAKKIVWQVTDSNLTFLNKPDEWTGTFIEFELLPHGDKTTVRFTHRGLVPSIECYNGCSTAWTSYLKNFAKAGG